MKEEMDSFVQLIILSTIQNANAIFDNAMIYVFICLYSFQEWHACFLEPLRGEQVAMSQHDSFM